jgi:serine kinase of HPr protein (carbohydrate metabolism regulator)
MNIDVKEFIKNIEGEILTDNVDVDSLNIRSGYVSDLLSDVMANAKDNHIWITIMKHLNSVAVASLANIPCIVFANGVMPDREVINKGKEENILLISSKLSSFQIAGKLYSMLKS